MAGKFEDIGTGISYENFPKDPAAREAITIVNNKVEEIKEKTVIKQEIINLENKIKQSGYDNDNLIAGFKKEIEELDKKMDGIDGGNYEKIAELEEAVNGKAPRDLVDNLLGQIEGSIKQINGVEPDEQGNVIIDINTQGLVTKAELTQKTDEIANSIYNKAEKTEVTELTTQLSAKASVTSVTALTSQLAETEKRFVNELHMSDFPKIGNETDDSGRLQRAIDSFPGNIAGTIQIAGDLRVSKQITCNKTGLRLVGVNNRISRIISTFGGIALFIKPLLDGAPYTSVSYCKFYIDNIAIVAEGDAILTGTGLWLQWIYASSFTNLYTSGFAKHIVLKGSHLNNFYNLYQGNKDSSVYTNELHNRGIGLSGDGTLEAGESTSNNNHIIGGWINNCSLDLRNMPGTVFEKIDIEPASNTIFTGDGAIFTGSRFERFDLYAFDGVYDRFPWFVLGSNCKFYNNEYHNSGPNNDVNVNPLFLINGDFNEIVIPNIISFNNGLLKLSKDAKGNTIHLNSQYKENEFKTEEETIKLNNNNNRVVYNDNLQGTIVDVVGSHTKAQGQFICRNSKNLNIVNSEDYFYQNITSSEVDIPLPIGRTFGTPSFTKIKIDSVAGDRRMLLIGGNAQTAPKKGVYTLTATIFIPSTTSKGIGIGVSTNAYTPVDIFDEWVTVRSRAFLNAGDKIIPAFQSNGVVGDVFYVGEISVCDGNASVYIPNDTYESVSASF